MHTRNVLFKKSLPRLIYSGMVKIAALLFLCNVTIAQAEYSRAAQKWTHEGAWNLDSWVKVVEPRSKGTGYEVHFTFGRGENWTPVGWRNGRLGFYETIDGNRYAFFEIDGAREGSINNWPDTCNLIRGAMHCIIEFNWEPDVWYKLRVWRLHDQRWGAWIITLDGNETNIGRIDTDVELPFVFRSESVMVTNPIIHCGAPPPRKAWFYTPILNANAQFAGFDGRTSHCLGRFGGVDQINNDPAVELRTGH